MELAQTIMNADLSTVAGYAFLFLLFVYALSGFSRETVRKWTESVFATIVTLRFGSKE